MKRDCKDCPCFEPKNSASYDGLCHYGPPDFISEDDCGGLYWEPKRVTDDYWCHLGQSIDTEPSRGGSCGYRSGE